MPESYGIESAQKTILIGDSSHSFLGRLLDTNGDGTGIKNMGAVANTYYIKPPTSRNYIIDEIVVILVDNGALAPGLFGAGAALATGCLLRVTEKPGASVKTIKRDILDGLTIKNNTHIAIIGNSDRWSDIANSSIIARCNFRDKGTPIAIHGDKGEALEFVTQDDLSGISELYVQVIGRETLASR